MGPVIETVAAGPEPATSAVAGADPSGRQFQGIRSMRMMAGRLVLEDATGATAEWTVAAEDVFLLGKRLSEGAAARRGRQLLALFAYFEGPRGATVRVAEREGRLIVAVNEHGA